MGGPGSGAKPKTYDSEWLENLQRAYDPGLSQAEVAQVLGTTDWTAGQADTHRYRQIGNAVTVPVIEWLAARIRQVHSF